VADGVGPVSLPWVLVLPITNQSAAPPRSRAIILEEVCGTDLGNTVMVSDPFERPSDGLLEASTIPLGIIPLGSFRKGDARTF
jgi:hypothetical protein